MELLKWERGASAVFRRVCKGRRDAHDQCVLHLTVNARTIVITNARRFDYAIMMSRFILRFQRAQQLDVRGDPLHCITIAREDGGADKWLQALVGLTALTSLNLKGRNRVSDDGLRALGAGLTGLATLKLEYCPEFSDNGLRTQGGLTALTDLNLRYCRPLLDNGLRVLGGLTALASLNL
jgi:hypothetical protein